MAGTRKMSTGPLTLVASFALAAAAFVILSPVVVADDDASGERARVAPQYQPGSVTRQPGHLIDFMATFLDVTDATYPTRVGDRLIDPLQGKSLLPIFQGEVRQPHETLYFHFGTDRAIRQGPWKLVSAKLGRWELYNIDDDRTELHDLASQQPDRVAAMAAEWFRTASDAPVQRMLEDLLVRVI